MNGHKFMVKTVWLRRLEIIQTPVRAANACAIAAQFVRTVCSECLD